MKRCPQCEFIYEDDQSLCDMDGILLVFDSQKLPKSRVSAPGSRSSHWRSRVVTALAGLVLAAVLGLVYFVSTNRQRVSQPTLTSGQPSMNASAAAAASESKTQAETNQASDKDPKVSSPEASLKSEPKESDDKPKSNVSPAAVKSAEEKQPKAKSTSTQKAQSSTQTKKTESKVGSLIKKTGRLLKKPFKF